MLILSPRTTDEKYSKLTSLAEEQNTSVNKVIDELVTIALTEREAYMRFTRRAQRGNAKNALDILESKAS